MYCSKWEKKCGIAGNSWWECWERLQSLLSLQETCEEFVIIKLTIMRHTSSVAFSATQPSCHSPECSVCVDTGRTGRPWESKAGACCREVTHHPAGKQRQVNLVQRKLITAWAKRKNMPLMHLRLHSLRRKTQQKNPSLLKRSPPWVSFWTQIQIMFLHNTHDTKEPLRCQCVCYIIYPDFSISSASSDFRMSSVANERHSLNVRRG